jgi:hypothetical protein
MSNSVKRAWSSVWDNIGFICIVLVLGFCLVHAFDPPRLNWGDPGSDFNTLVGGRNFQKYGFLKLRLTPFLLDPAVMTKADSVMIYTHYPPFPVLMNGVLRDVFRMSGLVQFRFVALGLSFASLFFIYDLIALYWSRRTAQIAIGLWVMNPLWIQHADYLHHIPYGAFFGFGSLFCLVRYLRDERRWSQLLSAGVLLFLTFLSSYDWWFFGPLLIAMATVGHYRAVFNRPVIRVLAILGVCAAAGVLFKLATNAWALDGLTPFLRDLRFQFAERATDSITRSSYRMGAWPTLYGRVERFFTLLLFPVTAFWALYPTIRRRWGDKLPAAARTVVNPGWLLIAALPFLILFIELWVAQYYPGILVIPFYAVGCAAIATMLYESGGRAARVAAGVFVFVLLGNSVDENLNFKAAFFDQDAIVTLGRVLARLSPPDKEVLVNHVFDGQYRYYFNRKIVALALMPPRVTDLALASLSNPMTHPNTATADGAVFVQHKHLLDEMYDKGYYYILGRYHLWWAWGNPRKNRVFIDSLMADRDSTLMVNVAKVGRKVAETDFYTVWRIPAKRDTVRR